MDQSVEAVIATMLFLGSLAFFHYVIVGVYSSVLNGEYESIKASMASLVSSSIVIENGSSYQKWLSWVPSSIPDSYGILRSIKIWINASTFSANGLDGLHLGWSKCAGVPLFGGGVVEYDRMILLDDGSIVLLRVVVG